MMPCQVCTCNSCISNRWHHCHCPAEEDKAKWGHKILMGLNFYGYDYSGQGAKEAVTGKDVMKLLDKHGPQLQWHQEHFEHFFEYEGLVGG